MTGVQTCALPISEETEWLDQSARASIWDNKVRVVFMPLVAIAALSAIIVAFAFGRSPRTRRWFVRIAATLGVIALAEQAFFREPLTTCVLLATAAVIALLAGGLPLNDEEPEEEDLELGEPEPDEEQGNELNDEHGNESDEEQGNDPNNESDNVQGDSAEQGDDRESE